MKNRAISQSSYSTFIDKVQTKQVEQVNIIGSRLDYRLKEEFGSERFFTTTNQSLRKLTKFLEQHNVNYTVVETNSSSKNQSSDKTVNNIESIIAMLLSTGILVGAFAWLAKLSAAGGGTGLGMGIGKSKAKAYAQGKTGISFQDVAGVDEAKQELQEVVDFLQNSTKYQQIGAKMPKGVLLVGAPGTGKTLLAKAVAGEAGVPFLSMSASEFVEVYVGVGASRVRDLFAQAKRQAPCIVFIDELDAIGKSRGSNPQGGNDEREQTLNQLLTEMDGFAENTGVIVIAATNRPEILDPALRRPGRFDRQVLVDRPDKKGRIAILQVHAQNVSLGEDIDLEKIAGYTAGFAGADLANLVNEAALMAARNNRQAVLMADFGEAIERIIAGLEKRSRILTDLERQTVAYHEVGHALVGALMPGNNKVTKISIVPRGLGALGYTLQMPETDRFLVLEDELKGQIATLLGGRSAEEIIFNKVSTGASDDIQKATDLAEKAITQYGMSKDLGPIAFTKTQNQFLNSSVARRNYGGATAATIDSLLKTQIESAHQMALAILKLNRELLESATQTLLEQEVLEGEQLTNILNQVQAPANLAEWLNK